MAFDKKTVMLRYPADYIQSIDNTISESGMYLNRSDYVVSCARHYYSWIIASYNSDVLESEKKEKIIQEHFIFGKILLTSSIDEISKFGGPITPVSVQIPIKLYEDIQYLSGVLNYFSGIQDYIKISIYFQEMSRTRLDLIRKHSDLIKEHSNAIMQEYMMKFHDEILGLIESAWRLKKEKYEKDETNEDEP